MGIVPSAEIVFSDGLPASEIEALDNWTNWVGDAQCAATSQATGSSTIQPGPIYIMGDSITALAKSTYLSKFSSSAGWSPTVNGLVSRQITGGVSPDGMTQINSDQSTISKANAIVIALGTNGVTNPASVTKSQVQTMLTTLKSYDKQGAPIYWVNVLDTQHDLASQTTNQAIKDAVGGDGVVIDWYGTAKNQANLSSFNDGVHPTQQKDIDLLVSLVYNTVTNTPTSSIPSGTSTCACSDGSTTLVGNDPEQQVWNYFKGKGLSDPQVAGIMGNMEQESHFDPLIMEIGGRSKNPYDAGSKGWGLIQWSGNAGPTSTGDKVTSEYKASGVTGPIYELATQLDLVWQNMNNNPVVTQPFDLNHFKTINDPVQAAVYFGSQIEGFGIAGARYADAPTIMQKYAGTSGGSSTTASSSCGTSAACTPSTTVSASGLSQTRQNIVCIAQQQLSLWESKPGYPYPAYAHDGFLDYSQGVYEEWCADFASWVYKQAGTPFSGGKNGWGYAGVSALQNQGQTNSNFQWHPAGSGYTPQPGDLAIHGGNHVNVFISSSGGATTYIGGDQGSPPDGVYGGSGTTTSPNPPSESNVSIEKGNGYWDNGITGYVSPK